MAGLAVLADDRRDVPRPGDRLGQLLLRQPRQETAGRVGRGGLGLLAGQDRLERVGEAACEAAANTTVVQLDHVVGSAGDAFGVAVSIEGTTVAVGADGVLSMDPGATYLFDVSDPANPVAIQPKLIASDGSPGDGFGSKVSISGERTVDNSVGNGSYMRSERVFGKFARSFALPAMIPTEKITASFKDGVLELRLPRLRASKRHKISLT